MSASKLLTFRQMSETRQALPTFVPDNRYSIEEWLAIEEVTGERYEYHEGQLVSVTAMAGGTPEHALLISNATGVSYQALSDPKFRAAPCSTYSSDLRLALKSQERYVYPDLAIVCGKPQYDEVVSSAINNPIAIFEVVSTSSVAFDSGKKFDWYSQLVTLRDYVLLAQSKMRVEVYSRASINDKWNIQVFANRSDTFALAGLPGAQFKLADVYRDWEAPRQ